MGKTLIDIKRALDANVGKRITIKANGGRHKIKKLLRRALHQYM